MLNSNVQIESAPYVMRISIESPFVTVEEYSDRSGLSIRSVREQCAQGTLPIALRKRDGERYMINIALLTRRALEADF